MRSARYYVSVLVDVRISCFLRRSGVECSALGVTEPERRRPHLLTSDRGQNPTPPSLRPSPLPTDAEDLWRLRYEIHSITHRKQTASFRIAGSMLAIAPLWLMLAAANTSAYAQTSDNVSDASATTTPHPHLRTGHSFTATTCSAGIRMRRS